MKTQKMTGRILWLDQLRAIAMFFVVLGHVALPKEINRYIYAFHMPLFFIISGMTHRPNKYKTLKDCIMDKGKKLMIPFFMMNIVMFPLWIVNFKILTVAKPTILELVKGLFFIHSGEYQTPSNATWFLAALFLIEILMYVIEKVTKGELGKMKWYIFACAIISYMESIGGNKNMPWHLDAALSGIVFYYCGYLLIQNIGVIQEKIEKSKSKYIGLIVLFTIVGFYVSDLNGRVSMNGNVQNSIIYYYVSAFAFSFALIMCIIKLPNFKLLSYIGRNTLLYLGFHIPMIRFLERVLPKLGVGTERWYAFGIAIVVYLLMVVVVAFVNNFLPFVAAKTYKNFKYKKLAYVVTAITILTYIFVIGYVMDIAFTRETLRWY